MAWTIDQPIRVGDNVTNLMLGQMALEIDALHDGFVSTSGTATPTTVIRPITQSLENANGVTVFGGGDNPPYVIYSFPNNYKRKPPYLVTATMHAVRPTTRSFKAWIIRQPVYVADAGREYTDVASYVNDWNTELGYGTLISNIEGKEPHAYLAANSNGSGDNRLQMAMRVITDDVPSRIRYSNGDTVTYYNDFFHLALAPSGGSTSDLIGVFAVALTIIGGR